MRIRPGRLGARAPSYRALVALMAHSSPRASRRPTAASAARIGRPAVPGPVAARRPARRRPPRPHVAAGEGRPDGADQRHALQGDPDNDFDRGPLHPELETKVLEDNLVGSILSGGGASPAVNTPQAWAEMINELQPFAIAHSQHADIPIIYGADAVHGHNNLLGATMFPHQVGLGSSFDAALAQQLGGRDRARRARDRHPLGLRAGRSTPSATCAGAAATSRSARTRC